MSLKHVLLTLLVAGISAPLAAAPMVYKVDPDHTHPVFEADHFDGLSVWRGLFSKVTGEITLDKAAQTGSVDITVDPTSVETGVAQLNKIIAGPQLLDAVKYPVVHYTGKLGGFVQGKPTNVTGNLTLHGITRPLTLKILSFKCVPHPLLKRDWCGADALAQFNRDDFGIDSGKQYGFRMQTTLRIQIEAIAVK
ncbi:MAG: YceI family protein [Gammaproteobacteria bacterium]